jgi:hypothetical protein
MRRGSDYCPENSLRFDRRGKVSFNTSWKPGVYAISWTRLAAISRSRLDEWRESVVKVWWGGARAELEDTNFNDTSSALTSYFTRETPFEVWKYSIFDQGILYTVRSWPVPVHLISSTVRAQLVLPGLFQSPIIAEPVADRVPSLS